MPYKKVFWCADCPSGDCDAVKCVDCQHHAENCTCGDGRFDR